MTVAVEMTKAAKKDFDKLETATKARIANVLAELANYPAVANVKALKGNLKGSFRVRDGKWRVSFTVAAGVLTVTSIDVRKDAY